MSSIGSGRLFVCLANNIKAEEIEGLAQGILGWRDEQEPEGEVICVFQDSSFEDNVAKTNLCAILEQAGIKKSGAYSNMLYSIHISDFYVYLAIRNSCIAML